jgi:hypothetical protein
MITCNALMIRVAKFPTSAIAARDGHGVDGAFKLADHGLRI